MKKRKWSGHIGKEINRHWGRRKDGRSDGKKGRTPGSSGSLYLWSQITTAGKNLPDDWINNFLFLPALCKWFWLGWDPRKAWEEKQSKSREMIIRWNKHGHVLKAAQLFAALGKHTLVTSLFPTFPIASLQIQSQVFLLTAKLRISGL